MEKEFNEKYNIVFDKSIVQITYKLLKDVYFVNKYRGFSDNASTKLNGVRTIEYTIDKNLGIIIQEDKQ